MRLHLSKSLLASLAAAGALVGGAFLTPASAQDGGTERKPATLTISGTALNPDGSPAAKLPVAIKSPDKKPMGAAGDGEGGGAPAPDLLMQGGAKGKGKAKGEGMLKTLAKGMTDDSGHFALKFTTLGQGDQTVFVEIGDPTKTPWAKQTVVTEGKDKDLGNIQLSPKAGTGGQ